MADLEYRWTQRLTVGVQEVFQQNSTAFSQPYTYSGATISGSGVVGSPAVILPYAGQIQETTPGHIEYQISRNSLIGASGYFSTFQFSDSSQVTGLYNSRSYGGSANYSRRLTRTQFFGVLYQYSTSSTTSPANAATVAYPPVSTESHYAQLFYTANLTNRLSLSLTGGPEYTTTSVPGSEEVNTWAPSGHATLGWHETRANFAVGYSRSVSTGWGLLGSFTADSANATASWQFTRRLVGTVNGNYGNTRNATPLLVSAYTATGHTFFERAALEYQLSEHLHLVGEYARLHEHYTGIAAFSSSPDSDRVAVTLNYGFQRPLGR
jgi:hypothetical protein